MSRRRAEEEPGGAEQPLLKRSKSGESAASAATSVAPRTLRFEAMDRLFVLRGADDVEAFSAEVRSWMAKSAAELSADAVRTEAAGAAVASSGDVVLHIAGFCDAQTLCALRATCRGLRATMNSDAAGRAWERAYVEIEEVMVAQNKRSAGALPKLQSFLSNDFAYIRPGSILEAGEPAAPMVHKAGLGYLKCADRFVKETTERLDYLVGKRRYSDAAEVFSHVGEIMQLLLRYAIRHRSSVDMLRVESIIKALLRDILLRTEIDASAQHRADAAHHLANLFDVEAARSGMEGGVETAGFAIHLFAGGYMDVAWAIRSGWAPLNRLLAIRGWTVPIRGLREGDEGYREFCELQSESPLLKRARAYALRDACGIRRNRDPCQEYLEYRLGRARAPEAEAAWCSEKAPLEYRRYTEAFGTAFEELCARMRFREDAQLAHGACLDLILREARDLGEVEPGIEQNMKKADLSVLVSKTADVLNGAAGGSGSDDLACRLLLSAVDLAHWRGPAGQPFVEDMPMQPKPHWCNGAADRMLESWLSVSGTIDICMSNGAPLIADIGYMPTRQYHLCPGEVIKVGGIRGISITKVPGNLFQFFADGAVGASVHGVREDCETCYERVCFSLDQISNVYELVQSYIGAATAASDPSLACALAECDFAHPLITGLGEGIGVLGWFVQWARLCPDERRRTWLPAVLWVATRACQAAFATSSALGGLLATLASDKAKLPREGALKIAEWVATAWRWPRYPRMHRADMKSRSVRGPDADTLNAIGRERVIWYKFLLELDEPASAEELEALWHEHAMAHSFRGILSIDNNHNAAADLDRFDRDRKSQAERGCFISEVEDGADDDPWWVSYKAIYASAVTAVHVLEDASVPAEAKGHLADEVLTLVRRVRWLPPDAVMQHYTGDHGYFQFDSMWHMLGAHEIDHGDSSLASIRMRAFADLAFRAMNSLAGTAHARSILTATIDGIRWCRSNIAKFYTVAETDAAAAKLLPAMVMHIATMGSIFVAHITRVPWQDDFAELADALLDALSIADGLGETSWSFTSTHFYHDLWRQVRDTGMEKVPWAFIAFLEADDREIFVGPQKNSCTFHLSAARDAIGFEGTRADLERGVDVWGDLIEVKLVGKGHEKCLRIKKNDRPAAHLKQEVGELVQVLGAMKAGPEQ